MQLCLIAGGIESTYKAFRTDNNFWAWNKRQKGNNDISKNKAKMSLI